MSRIVCTSDFVIGFDSLLGLPALLNTEMRSGMIERLLELKMDEILSASPNTDKTAESDDSR